MSGALPGMKNLYQKLFNATTRWSMRTRLVALFLLAGLIPLVTVGSIAVNLAAQRLKHDVGHALELLAFNTADKLDRNLFERYGDVQAFARSVAARSMEPTGITAWMDTMMATYSPVYVLMVAADRSGHIISANTVDLDGKALRTEALIGLDVSATNWFQEAMALSEGVSFVEDLHADDLVARVYGAGPRSYAMSFSAPIRDAQGQVVGVWSNRFNWQAAMQIVSEAVASETERESLQLHVINSQRLSLASPDPTDILQLRLNAPIVSTALKPAARGYSGGIALMDSEAEDSEVTEGVSMITGANLAATDNRQTVGYFRSRGYSSYPGVGWAVIASVDDHEALAGKRALLAATILTGLILATIIAVAAVLLSRSLTAPIRRVADALHELATAEADLTRRLPVRNDDEIGQLSSSFNLFMEKLGGLIAQVLSFGGQMTGNTARIAAGAQQLEATMNEQVAATNEVAATARQISETAEGLSSTVDDVTTASKFMAASAGTGKQDLTEMEQQATNMERDYRSVSTRLSAINERAVSIEAVVTTIAKVANQTNLLSLNAAIEAEKAGEHGQGFAVVAREIRRLADQTASATLEIEKMVQEMKLAVVAGEGSMQAFSDRLRESVATASRTSEALSGIIADVQSTASRFYEVQEGVRSQSHSAHGISEAMSQLSEATHSTASALSDTNKAIAELNDTATSLQDAFARFRLG